MTKSALGIVTIVAVALMLIALGCDDGSTGESRHSNLVISNSTPSDGNTTLTEPAGLDTAPVGEDVLVLTHRVIGARVRQVTVRVDDTTDAILSIEYRWDNEITQCAAVECGAANVLDRQARTLTLTQVVLHEPPVLFPDLSATLDGTIEW